MRHARTAGREHQAGKARHHGIAVPAIRPLEDDGDGRLVALGLVCRRTRLRHIGERVGPVPGALAEEHEPFAVGGRGNGKWVRLPANLDAKRWHADAHVLSGTPAGAERGDENADNIGAWEREELGVRDASLEDGREDRDRVEDGGGDAGSAVQGGGDSPIRHPDRDMPCHANEECNDANDVADLEQPVQASTNPWERGEDEEQQADIAGGAKCHAGARNIFDKDAIAQPLPHYHVSRAYTSTHQSSPCVQSSR